MAVQRDLDAVAKGWFPVNDVDGLRATGTLPAGMFIDLRLSCLEIATWMLALNMSAAAAAITM